MPPKKPKTQEEHLQTIEYLLAGIILKREPDTARVAKVLGIQKNKLIKMFPSNKSKKRK